MAITPGTRVGPYEVTSTLGAGGMGVVFRARDTALQRDVALKLLPERFTSDPDRLSRFQREAQILASLNHPNIAQVYGLEQSEGSNCIVMELVDGETLAERIRRGPIPVDETLRIARHIVDALEAAHERGIIHRDLKPANIKITPEGNVKVLDFGLAKAIHENPGADVSQSPTMLTATAGVILGTAGYMSPEQARGRSLDKRTDIWAFGCVLYEMLTGSRAFEGEDATEILGAVIHKEPSWEHIPASMKTVIRRCLEKDPKRRLRDIGDALPLVDVSPETVRPTATRAAWLSWAVALVFLATTAVFATLYLRQETPQPQVVRFQVAPPPKTDFALTKMALSPDGRHMAFVARGTDNIQQIWVHHLDTIESQLLAGTDGVTGTPFWSPDGKYLGFSIGTQLKKIDPAGGPAQTLCTSATQVGLGGWNRSDIIVFGGPPGAAIQKVSAAGGIPTPVTNLKYPKGSGFHSNPSFLPDGEHFLYYVSGGAGRGVYIGSVNKKPEEQDQTRLLDTQWNAVYASTSDPKSGILMFINDGTLMAQTFDTVKLMLTGQSRPVTEHIALANNVVGLYSVSENGVLAYRTANSSSRTPVLLDRTGRDVASLTPAPLEDPATPRLSPNDRQLALRAGADLWVYDLQGRPPIRLTFGGDPLSPFWTPDGKRIIYEVNAPNEARDSTGKTPSVSGGSLLSLPGDGSGVSPEPASPSGHFHPYGWSSDGKDLIATQYDGSETNVVRFPPAANGTILPLVKTPAAEGQNGLSTSPDGKWLAYSSNTTGAFEIWVRSLTETGAPIRVSPNGGIDPLWARNGKELYYFEGTRLMAVDVDTRSGFNFKPAVRLFDVPYMNAFGQPPHYDVTAKGEFLLLRPANPTVSPITVILNWAK